MPIAPLYPKMLVTHIQSVMVDVWFVGPVAFTACFELDYSMNNTCLYLILFARTTRRKSDLYGVVGSSVPTSMDEYTDVGHTPRHEHWKSPPISTTSVTKAAGVIPSKYAALCLDMTACRDRRICVDSAMNKGRLGNGLISVLPRLYMLMPYWSVQQCTSNILPLSLPLPLVSVLLTLMEQEGNSTSNISYNRVERVQQCASLSSFADMTKDYFNYYLIICVIMLYYACLSIQQWVSNIYIDSIFNFSIECMCMILYDLHAIIESSAVNLIRENLYQFPQPCACLLIYISNYLFCIIAVHIIMPVFTTVHEYYKSRGY